MLKKILLITLFITNIFANSDDLGLTPLEKDWIKNHPVINVGGEMDWAPFDFVDENRNYNGLAKDYLDMIASIAGFKVKYHTGKSWKELLLSIKTGEIDMLPSLYKNKEREKYITFTHSYLTLSDYIFTTSQNSDLNSLDKLSGHTIALIKGFDNVSWIKKRYPTIKIIEKNTILECLESLKIGESVAFVGDNPSTTYSINKNFITDIQLNNVIEERNPTKLYMGIKKEYKILATIINKVIKSQLDDNLSIISAKWMKVIENKDLILTDIEKKWMSNNPINRIAVMTYWPHDKNGDSFHTEMLKLINHYSGLILVPIKFDKWGDAYLKAKTADGIHGIMGLSWSKEREDFFSYTAPYSFTPAHLVTRTTNTTIKTLQDLKNKTVLLKENEITHKILNDKIPSSKVIDFKTSENMIKKLSEDRSTDALFSYYMDQNVLKKYNLKIVNKIYDRYGEVSIGVNNSYKILSNIINKTLKIIPKKELSDLRDKDWGNIKSDTKISTKELKYIAENNLVRVCTNPNWEPIEFTKDGKAQGISLDVLGIIKEKLNIKYDFIPTTSWKESQEFLKEGKCDILPSATRTLQREKYANFTKSYLNYKLAIITRSNEPLVSNFENIVSKKMSRKKASGLIEKLKLKYPNIEIKETSSYKDALNSVISGDTYFTISTVHVFSYFKSKYTLKDLQVAGYSDFEFDLSIAVRKDKEILLGVLNKVLLTIPQSTLQLIHEKWASAKIVKHTDWDLLFKIFSVIFLVVIVILVYNRRLQSMVNAKTKDINEQKEELIALMASLDKNVIYSKTDLQGVITHVSEAFCTICGYTKEELLGKSYKLLRHPDMPSSLFKKMWINLKKEKIFEVEIKNLRKDGGFYWINSHMEPEYDSIQKHIGYSAVITEITDKKAIEELSKTLEAKVVSRTHELTMQKKQIEGILENILLPVLITSKDSRIIMYANKSAEIQYGLPIDEMVGSSIDHVYTMKNQKKIILKELQAKGFIESLEQSFSTHAGKEFVGLLSVKPIMYEGEEAYLGMTTDISYQKRIEEEIREVHKLTRDSIEYASLIQHSLIPRNDSFNKYFEEYLTIWHPKDIVGGDIYLFEELRDNNECLLMVIDCTGHGVPGAFVTMLVKAIERQIIATIKHNPKEEVSPGKLLQIFNKNMKKILRQENVDSISNAGFDGGILYYNKKDKIIKYSGAETPLFYIDKNKKLQMIKGDRHSIGYKKSDANFEFKDHNIEVQDGMQFYVTTDGYLDQNGGSKGFPFGKKSFTSLIKEYNHESFADQQEIFLDELHFYQGDEDRNDDVTLIAFKI